MKIIWSPFAHQRVYEIADYIAYDSLTAAEKWVNSIYDSVKKRKDLPKAAELSQKLASSTSEKFSLPGKAIKILTVRHGKQFLPTEDLSNE